MSFIVPYPLDPTAETGVPVASLLQRVLPPSLLEELEVRWRPPHSRRRKLPGSLLLSLLVAMHLIPAALDVVLETLTLGQADAAHRADPAGKSSISRARARWGVQPITALFRQVCRPLATPHTPGAWLFGFRAMALDASYEDVADTPANEQVFGRHHSQHGPAAFPQLKGMYLVECGTHAICDAGIWPCRVSDHQAAQRLVRSIRADMLVLWDAGLHSFALAQAVRDRGAHFLSRVPAQQTFEPVAVLQDGSLLARFYSAPPSRRSARTPFLLVRVVSYTIDDGSPQRVMTSLLDPELAPAHDLVTGYHVRWEIELVFDELDTHQRLLPGPLRSKTPRGIIQELYGLLLAHYAVRAVMVEAARQAEAAPTQLSFTRAIRVLAAVVPLADLLPPAEYDHLVGLLLAAVARSPLPARRQRRVPRARKRPWSRHGFRRRGRHYQGSPLPPLEDRIVLLPPSPPPKAA
jgi:Transposase DDE domain/Insertion element 4 transposase N-terminal